MTSPSYPLVFPVSGDWWSCGDPALTATTSAPEFLPISGLVTFTPRLPKGFTAYMSNFPAAGNVNCQQTVTVLGSPTGGTFTLSYGGYTTAALPFNVTPATMQSSLTGLTSIGTGNATVVAGSGANVYIVTFQGTLANKPIVVMTSNPTLLTPSGCSVTVSITQAGSTARAATVGFEIPPRQGRIWAGQLSSIDVADSPGVQLISNDPNLNLIDQNIASLIYDVMFTQVQYNSSLGTLQNFAFAAPPDTTPVNLTNPEFPRLSFQPPSS